MSHRLAYIITMRLRVPRLCCHVDTIDESLDSRQVHGPQGQEFLENALKLGPSSKGYSVSGY